MAGLDTLVRGVGRTGAPAPIIHDFCRAPPTSVLNVAFELSTSRSVTTFPSLSGGRRIAQQKRRKDIDPVGIEEIRIAVMLGKVSHTPVQNRATDSGGM